jgi:hypothetical protein
MEIGVRPKDALFGFREVARILRQIQPMRFTIREIHPPGDIVPPALTSFLRYSAITLGLSFAFTWFNVYGSNDYFLPALTMWILTLGAGNAAAVVIIPYVFGTRFQNVHPILQILMAALLIAIPVTTVLLTFQHVVASNVTLIVVPYQFVYVLAVCVFLVIIGYLLHRSNLAMFTPGNFSAGAYKETNNGLSVFMERLPIKYRGAALYAISSEDHYLRVHTDRGEELILMRLADAIRELNGARGLQTHRSWWVAEDGVSDARRINGKLILHLKSGAEAPVSRTYQAAVKDRGLI